MSARPVPTRPALRYHGGKWKLAPWIIRHLPPHRVYVEPFGGAASVLLRKPRSYAEIYNDLDGEIVSYFRVLRDPAQAARLTELLRLTPFARAEFAAAYEPSGDPVEAARRLVIRAFMGYGSGGFNTAVKTGFRANSNRSGTTPAHDWASFTEIVPALVERLQGVVIEQQDAAKVMARFDGPDTLHYVDPPYVPATRSNKSRRCPGGGPGARYHAYRHEMSAADHRTLAARLHALEGLVVLSGYHSALYDELFADWVSVECAALADGARPRTEVLWFNRRGYGAWLSGETAGPLFASGEAAE